MCGIVGVLEFKSQGLEQEALQQMTAALGHRGPEQQGTHWLGDPSLRVGLGHTRLKIIDLSDAAGQPMRNDDGSIWLVFNGEIYNYQELRSRLQQRGVRFRTTSDTEVLLRWYEAEGPQCVRRFEGMFAFAVWDGRRRRLLIARDRVGKKPLFYAPTPGRFAFASEIKALLRHPGIESEVNREALPAFFLYGYVPTPDTLYRGVFKLPPGHLAQVGADGVVQIESYWELPLPDVSRSAKPSEAEACATVRQLLTDAVRRRLIADVPLGAFLSGGLDSSIVVGLMSQLMSEPVRTFSIGFANQPHFDETGYARLVAKRWNTQHREYVVDPASVGLVEQLVWHHDGPFADSSAIPTYLLSQLTRQHVTVALNGDGGDELFAGYLRFHATLLAEHLPVWVRTTIHRMGTHLPLWGGMRGPVRRLQKFADGAQLPLTERFSRWVAVFYDDLPSLLPEGANGEMPLAPLRRLETELSQQDGISSLTRLLRLNVKTYLLDDLLVKMDRCSMAHALETRSPFLDRALMEYVMKLPDTVKFRLGRTKHLLRRSFTDLVPPEVLRRGKMGFGVPLQAWFGSELRAYLHDMLLTPEARLRQYVNQSYVRRLYEAHGNGSADYSHRLWTLLTFEIWLRQLPQWTARPTQHAAALDPSTIVRPHPQEPRHVAR